MSTLELLPNSILDYHSDNELYNQILEAQNKRKRFIHLEEPIQKRQQIILELKGYKVYDDTIVWRIKSGE